MLVGDSGPDLLRHRRRPRRTAKATPGGDVVESQRHRRPPRTALRCRPRRAARAGASRRRRAARSRSASAAMPSPGGELDPGVVAGPALRSARRRRRSGWPAPGRGWPRRGRSRRPRRQPSPPAMPQRARVRRRVVVDQDRLRSAVQPTLPAKSVTQWLTRCGPSLKRGRVDRGVAGDARARQGCIRVARHSPPIERLRAGVLGERRRGRRRCSASPKRMPRADVGAAEAEATGPRAASRRSSRSPPIAGAGGMAVLDRDRQRPQRRPRARVEAAPLALGAGAEQAVLERRPGPARSRRRIRAGRRRCSRRRRRRRSRRPRCRRPIRCSKPSCRACHQVPLTW